jgi:glycine/D-amino acid oxidase-like deaminating enzyme
MKFKIVIDHMNISHYKEDSVWLGESTPSTYYPSLVGYHSTDVVIIGGGLAGILSAYFIAKTGKKVYLLEERMIGGGATGHTTGFITQSLDTLASSLIKIHGNEKAKKIYDSHKWAINEIQSIVKRENINCEFEECSNYIYAETLKEYKELQKEYKALESLDVTCELFETDEKLGFDHCGYIEIKNQAKFNPVLFIFALADKVSRSNKVVIFENTKVKDMIELESNPIVLLTETGEIIAEQVIVATQSPFNKPLPLYFKKSMYVSYVLELEMKKPSLTVGTYENMKNPYNYFRVDMVDGKERVIIGGEDHRADIRVSTKKSFEALEMYAQKLFKEHSFVIKRRWRGPILEPVDGLPFIGSLKDDNRVNYSFAFSGNGMTYSVIAARVMKDLIAGNEDQFLHLYDAKRSLSLRALATKGRDFAEEFFEGAVKNSFSNVSSKRDKKINN